MNRKNPPLIIGFMLSLLLATVSAGCSSDVDESHEQRVPVSFSTSFFKVSTTRSTLDNIWPNNFQITISDGTGKTYTYQTADNSSELASGATSSLKPVTDAIYWDNPTVVFSAWAPAGGTAAPASWTVPADQSILDNSDPDNPKGISDAAYLANDLLYCPPEITTFTFQQSTPIHLQFHHELARIIVRINSSYTEGHEETVDEVTVTKKEVVENVAFGGNRLALSGTITHSTTGANGSTTWALPETKNLSITKMRPLASLTNASNNVYAFECIVIPQANTTTTDALIDITTSGAEDHTHTLVARTYTYKSAFEFKSGYQYTYDLAISEQGTVTLDRVKVQDWDGTVVAVDNGAVIPANSYPMPSTSEPPSEPEPNP